MAPSPFLKGGATPLCAGEAWRALRKRSFPRSVNANFYKSPGLSAPARRGAPSKVRNIRNVSVGQPGAGAAFAAMKFRSRRFGVFLLFVQRAVCRFKERQLRGQSGKQGVPAQKSPPIDSAVSCVAMSPWLANVSRETPLLCRCFSKEPVPHNNIKKSAQASPQLRPGCAKIAAILLFIKHFGFYKTFRKGFAYLFHVKRVQTTGLSCVKGFVWARGCCL